MRGIAPVSRLLTPIPFVALVRRELLRNIRTTRMFLALLLMVSIGMIGTMGMWPQYDVPLIAVGSKSAELMAWFAMLLFGAACVLIPGYAGGAILEERNLDTLDLLRTSLIRPSGILAGKFLNVVGLFLLLTIAAMPLLATTYFLVGLNIDILFTMIIVLALVIVTSASIGLSCSVVQSGAVRAIIHSYLWTAIALGGYLIFVFLAGFTYQLIVNSDNPNEREIQAWVEWCANGSPFYLFARAAVTGIKLKAVLAVALVQGCFCLIAIVPAWLRLAHPRDGAVKSRGSLLSLLRRQNADTPTARKFTPIPVYRNPVFVRERRHAGAFRSMNRLRKMLLAIVAGTINVFLLYVLFIWRERPDTVSEYRDVTYVWSLFVGMFVVFLAPAIQSVAFVKEHEQDTKDFLAMTLLTPAEIAAGKLRAGFLGILQLFAIAYLCTLPVFGIAALATHGFAIVICFVVWTLLCATASLALGATASMTVRRTSLAVPFSYGLSVAYFAAPSIAVIILNEAFRFPLPRQWAENLAILLSPIASGFQFVGKVIGHGWEWSSDPYLENAFLLMLHVMIVLLFVIIALVIAHRRWLGKRSRMG